MKKAITAFVILHVATLVCAQCDGNRYRNFMFSEVVKTADIAYGENLNLEGAMEVLNMDVYEPAGDVSEERALVIVSHGGFFLTGSKEGEDVVPLCQDLARMGYVVASINYRLGIEFETPLNEPYGRTVMRALQDLRAAIRWFRQDAAGANSFGIDPEEIYTGGVSAGGFMAIHLAYLDEDEIPAYIDMSAPGLEGGIEGQSGNPGFSSEVNAIFNISGAIGDTAWIDPGENPVCLFHGDEDATVPFGSDTFFLFGIMEVVELDGSGSMNEKLDETGIPHCFEINEGYGHVPHLGNDAVYDTTLSIISNFLSHHICGDALDCSYRELETVTRVPSGAAISLPLFYPVPSEDMLFCKGCEQGDLMVLSDLSGRRLGAVVVTDSGRAALNAGALTQQVPGIYLLEVYREGRLLSCHKAVQQ